MCVNSTSQVKMPFIVLHGSADVVTDPAISQELYNKASSTDKLFNEYPKQMHCLLFEPKGDEVFQDILDWIEERQS